MTCAQWIRSCKRGEIRNYSFVPPEPVFVNLQQDMLPLIKDIAHDFWQRIAEDDRISDEFQNYLAKGNPVKL